MSKVIPASQLKIRPYGGQFIAEIYTPTGRRAKDNRIAVGVFSGKLLNQWREIIKAFDNSPEVKK